MDHHSDIKTDDTRAEELAVVVHEGQEFACGGFAIDVETGRMIAYVSLNEQGQYWLTTWQGERLARLHCSGVSRGFWSTRLEHFRTIEPIAGFYWYGKGLGVGMMLRLRKGRKAD